MKICHVITRLIVGGAQENTLATCIGLQKRGYYVELLTGPQTGPEGSLLPEATQLPVTIIPNLRREPNPWHDIRAAAELTRLFRARRYDIVHTHSGKAGILGRLAARLAGVPIVVHTIHGPSFYPQQNPLANWLFRWLEQLAAEWTSHFVSVADAMTDQYQAAGINGRYITIRSGFNLEAFLQVPQQPENHPPTVGKIARFSRLKGHQFLFEIAPRIVEAVPNARFLLVGDGIYRARYERLAERLGLRDSFEFAGLVPPSQIPAYLARMTVLVHLSLREGLARALPQAMACGKPVVSFDIGGAREVCRDNETGFLVRAGDTTALADAVIRLLQDKALAAKLGAAGRELVRQHFAEETMVEQIESLYQQLLAEHRLRLAAPSNPVVAPHPNTD
ncbi:MAG: glycosyltransferase family 4 protein [Verrucomicrobiae bacterium]|nr:glycosyltransferase family 4 protein [Verrucomicrobiae bacterium]